MKTAFIFPGQGSQYVGMGSDLYEDNESIRKIFDEAEEILEFPLRKICFEGPEEELKKTKYTQPAIFVHSLAVNHILAGKGIQAEAAAGHSLGEYSALVAAGALSFENGLRLVKLRGELMQNAGDKNPGTMAAVIGLSNEVVAEICETASKKGYVKPANFNSPGQIVISGSVEGVHYAMELAKENKARIVTELVVSGAFHSPLMEDAIGGLTEALAKTEISKPRIPVYTNVTAKPASEPEQIRELLQKQVLSPVLWQNIIENMIQDGIQRFYEVGPSKVLCGLGKRINRETECSSIGKIEDVKALEGEN